MRLIPAALLLASAVATAAEGPASTAGRRVLTVADPALMPQPKNLGIINDRFESMANAAHKAINKLANDPPSNDDPEIQHLLQLTVTINGTRLTQSPTPPSNPTSPASSDPLAPSAASPTPPASGPDSIATDGAESPGSSPSTQSAESTRPTQLTATGTLVPSPTPVNRPTDGESPHATTLDGDDGSDVEDAPSAQDVDEAESITTTSSTLDSGSVSISSTKATMAAATTHQASGIDEAEADDVEAPTTLIPTYSPSSISTKAPSAPSNTDATNSPLHNSAPSSNSQQESDEAADSGCPPEFDESKQYQEGDIVTLKRNRSCRGKRCHLIYKCKPWPESAYCSLVPPRTSDKGWLRIGRCAGNPSPAGGAVDTPTEGTGSPLSGSPAASPAAEGGSGLEDASPDIGTDAPSNATNGDVSDELTAKKGADSSNTTSPVASPSNASSIHADGEEEGHLPSPSTTTTLPTPSPTARRQFAYSPIWTKPSASGAGNSVDLDPANSILVNLPRIICDITLSSSLSHSFESNHVLIAAMTHMIYELFTQHLPKSLYELAGISLSVEVKRNDFEATESSTTVRLHAYFSGTASFSLQGAPSSNDLITLLIRYFDVDEFNLLLRQGPLKAARTRTAKRRVDEVKVNSVFFTLEDGTLVLAGSTYEENRLPTKTIAPEDENGNRVEVTFVILALIAMACVLALVMFLLYSNKMRDSEDEDNVADNVALASTDDLPASDDQSGVADGAPNSVEIEVPSTPQFALSDISDFRSDSGDENNSRVSSLSESPFPTKGAKSPPAHSFHRGLGQATSSTPSNLVGISNPNHYRYVGDPNLEETWQQQQQQPTKWELYNDSTTMGSL